MGEGPLRGEAERYELKEGDREGEGEKELDRVRVPHVRRDICTLSWLMHRAT